MNAPAAPLWRRLAGRCFALLWLWILMTSVGVAFRGAVNPPTTAFMQEKQLELESHGGHGRTIKYQWVDYAHIAPYMRLAVVTAEDQNFPYHHGFDWLAMDAAFQRNGKGHRIHGGSTISQQTAKNLWLWPGRSYLRKLVEAWFTGLMELEWPKQRILETYLNVAQLDDYTFGVGAAARDAFGVAPSALSAEQATLLAAALPAPDRFDVNEPSAHLQKRQAWILDQMIGLGGLSYLDDIEQP
ncbi:MAG TPA: monofunctional biosynthetic peptidoglycan transglycosylase [Gammaproteobacteria bacterium]|jgi:monofunctional biosynthetic peptidoglycan transglycosylase|nr:monofunctional biosynthetic peptidoglycan transglycosylase [Gammaproteobacteria bacterium]